MSFYANLFIDNDLIIAILIISGIISLIFFLNGADFFVKLNINNPKLAVSREKTAVQLGPALALLIVAWINLLFNSSINVNPLYYISSALFLVALFWRYFGFTGIFIPINDPTFLTASQAESEVGDYLEADLIIGIEYKNEARVYPIVPLQISHVVNDTIQGFDLAITFCGLCNLGIVFSRNINGEARKLRAVYAGRSNLVLTDDKGNYWQQLTGKGVLGKYAINHPLEIYDSTSTTWKSWKQKYPNTLVLGNRLKGRVKFGYRWFKHLLHLVRKTDFVLFPAGIQDDRYGPKEKLLGVIVNGNQIAIPVETYKDDIVINTDMNDKHLFLYFNHDTELYGAFEKSKLSTLKLTREADEMFIESEDGLEKWDTEGRKITAEENLTPLKKMYPAFWFVWIGHYPESRVLAP